MVWGWEGKKRLRVGERKGGGRAGEWGKGGGESSKERRQARGYRDGGRREILR